MTSDKSGDDGGDEAREALQRSFARWKESLSAIQARSQPASSPDSYTRLERDTLDRDRFDHEKSLVSREPTSIYQRVYRSYMGTAGILSAWLLLGVSPRTRSSPDGSAEGTIPGTDYGVEITNPSGAVWAVIMLLVYLGVRLESVWVQQSDFVYGSPQVNRSHNFAHVLAFLVGAIWVLIVYALALSQGGIPIAGVSYFGTAGQIVVCSLGLILCCLWWSGEWCEHPSPEKTRILVRHRRVATMGVLALSLLVMLNPIGPTIEHYTADGLAALCLHVVFVLLWFRNIRLEKKRQQLEST